MEKIGKGITSPCPVPGGEFPTAPGLRCEGSQRLPGHISRDPGASLLRSVERSKDRYRSLPMGSVGSRDQPRWGGGSDRAASAGLSTTWYNPMINIPYTSYNYREDINIDRYQWFKYIQVHVTCKSRVSLQLKSTDLTVCFDKNNRIQNDKESLSTEAQSYGNSVLNGERRLQGYEIVATPGCWTKAARCFLAYHQGSLSTSLRKILQVS